MFENEKQKKVCLKQKRIKLENLYKAVSPQFKYSAERMYSEALLDLENLYGNSETISLRNAIYMNE